MASDVDSYIRREIGKAQMAFRSGNVKEAASRVEKLYRDHPKRPEVLIAKAILLNSSGRTAEALDLFTSALERKPDDTECLGWTAFLCLNARRFEEAETYAKRLTAVDPQNARGFYLLANALRGQDRILPALEAIDVALTLNPNDVDSLVTKARLLKQWRMPGPAIDVYLRAMSIRPTAAAAHDLARIFLHESHPEDALELLRGVEAQFSPQERPHALIAESLTLLRRFDEAQGRWALAQKQYGNRHALHKQRAKAEIAAGRFEEAEALLRELIDRDIDLPDAFSVLTTARRMIGEDRPLLGRMEELAGSPTLPIEDRIKVHYALGKSFDDLREFEHAMLHFDRANALCLEIYPPRRSFNREAARALTDGIIQEFTVERMAEYMDRSVDTDLPLFVVGMIRSGTTLTESILGAHSQVVPGGEQSFWTERAIEFMSVDGSGFHYDHKKVRALADDYLRLVDRKTGARYVVDKNPANCDLTGVLHSVYPKSRFVHLLRHPVDNLLSIWMTPVSGNLAYASNRENMVFAYREHLRLLEHWRSVMPTQLFSTVRYEDLTSNPEHTIGELLDFLGLEREEACFAPERSDRTVLTPSVFQVRQPIHRQSQERWKNYEPWLGAFRELL